MRTTEDQIAGEHTAIMSATASKLHEAYQEGFDDGAKEAYAEGRRDQTDEFAELLPGPYYMDPPDGGSVTVLEQFRRMAEDAARYRWLRLPGSNVPISHEAARDGSVYDAAIDAARKA